MEMLLMILSTNLVGRKNYEKLCAISDERTVRFERLEAKFNDLTQCNSFLEEEMKSVKKVAEDAHASQKHLNDIVEALSAENKSLKKNS